MNPISALLKQNVAAFLFLHGLALFTLAISLALASRRTSELRFARALRPLAGFGAVHAAHEWFLMFRMLTVGQDAAPASIAIEWLQVAVLAVSFSLLALSGILLLFSRDVSAARAHALTTILFVFWGVVVTVAALVRQLSSYELVCTADVLARYLVGIPGSLLCAAGLMQQQRVFRRHGMPQFGRDLVWSAAALSLYGLFGQAFVRHTGQPPSSLVDCGPFLDWFGIPVELFRAVMAVAVTTFAIRALSAFELEDRLRIERLNEGLRLTARELTLLLDLTNLLASPMDLQSRLDTLLDRLVVSLGFPENGIVMLIPRVSGSPRIRSMTGFPDLLKSKNLRAYHHSMVKLAERSVTTGLVACLHFDGQIFQFPPTGGPEQDKCRGHHSPPAMIAFPLVARNEVIGSIVMGRTDVGDGKPIPEDEFRLMVGTVQQLGLSMENARLTQEAREREKVLGNLLGEVVGAREAERQRIARELHDVTAQSLSAIAMGLSGLAGRLDQESDDMGPSVLELKTFGTDALKELRNIIADLRPPQLDDLGLGAALQWYAREFEQRHATPCVLTLEGERSRMATEVETVLFRIAQEALANVARHAHASQVEVRLHFSRSQVMLAITDDGRGFDADATLDPDGSTGWGLLGIQERALLLGGECVVDAAPGQGTRIQVTVPLGRENGHVEDTTIAS